MGIEKANEIRCQKIQSLTTTVKINKTYCHINIIVPYAPLKSQVKEQINPTGWWGEFLWRSV